MLNFTKHARCRAAQWNLSQEDIEYVVAQGKRYHKAGAVFHYLRECDVPAEDHSLPQAARLLGTAVVLSKDEQWVITVWRNRQNGLQHIKRKTRFSTPGGKEIIQACL